MTIFFFLVSLEIKRELLMGELNSYKKAILPVIAAIGGVITPAIIFLLINIQHPEYLRGWAIPTPTDIAFSLGILLLVGKKISPHAKTFLIALAILDDLAAIIIISVFYTEQLSMLFMAYALLCIMLLIILNYLHINRFWPYLIIGILLWYCLAQAGIHSTIAGVITAFAIPLRDRNNNFSLLPKLEKRLHPWVAYAILPLFAFANTNFSLGSIQLHDLLNPLVLGIILGLFIGKQIGVFGAAWIAIKLGWAKLPSHVSWKQFYGIALLCGIGFTMSLFISNLAFADNQDYLPMIRLAIILGSLISGIAGFCMLRFSNK